MTFVLAVVVVAPGIAAAVAGGSTTPGLQRLSVLSVTGGGALAVRTSRDRR